MPKRTRAIKKTDVKAQKPWLKKIGDSSYLVEEVETNKTILIVGEGQTEKLYFESFPVITLTVEAIDLKGQSKLKLIESTTSIIENSDTKYDEIWCVFDMDVKQGEKEFSDFDNAITSGKSLGYKIAYSNDSFELWFYLHFNYTEQKHHRTFYYEFLGKQWNLNYKKDGKVYKFCQTIYSKLESDEYASQENAIESAKKLFNKQSTLPYHQQNPVSLVYELVNYLNANKRK
ncbi:RloB domain-containing protein [Kordia sp. YSTF-M3]|uniref:RloB domain-containing protein n=1 Tax=Kordia aestuariivivens TaxID=2759037 RepID=A0ABR7Q8E5_9FLAO|nr:RloB family protein [Kordia aestuariivivens]MBC8754807.1 RloB domain-containing protein [Kordia aestuariivivens]